MPTEAEGRRGEGMDDCSHVAVTAMDGDFARHVDRPPPPHCDEESVLTHPSSNAEHLVMRHTRLMGCLLSGSKSKHEEYLQRVRISSWPRGQQVQRSSTDRISGDGRSFVVGGILIPLIPMSAT